MCIIQDDNSDCISDVYGGSSLTIAAAGAPDGIYGCYFELDPQCVSSQQLCLTSSERPKIFICYNFDKYKQGIVDSPLAQRAWALQERFLTTRTVHSTRKQLMGFWREFSLRDFSRRNAHSADYTARAERKDNPNTWIVTVNTCSKCLLTQESDKLVAIAGILPWLHARTQDEYFSGVWKSTESISCYGTLKAVIVSTQHLTAHHRGLGSPLMAKYSGSCEAE